MGFTGTAAFNENVSGLIAASARKYPEAELALHEATYGVLLDEIEAGQLDVLSSGRYGASPTC